LRANTMLEDLYLMGNPCMEWDGAKEFIIGSLSQIKQLDGNLISRPSGFRLVRKSRSSWKSSARSARRT